MNIKKNIAEFFLAGSVGINISLFLAGIFSYVRLDGGFKFVNPVLIDVFGTEFRAVLVQIILSFLLGGISQISSRYIYDKDNWSLLTKTILHFIVVFGFVSLCAYTLRWIPFSFSGVLSFAIMFFMVYVIIYCIFYWSNKKNIDDINKKIMNMDKNEINI